MFLIAHSVITVINDLHQKMRLSAPLYFWAANYKNRVSKSVTCSLFRRYDFMPGRHASRFTLTFSRDTLDHMNTKRSNATQRHLRWWLPS